jgi:hypothetical protein
MPFEPKEYLYPAMPVTRELSKHADLVTSRAMGNFGNEFSGMYHVQGIEGYDAVYKQRYGEFMSAITDTKIHPLDRSVALFNKHGENAEKAIQLLGIGYYIHKVSDGRFPWAYPFWEYAHYDSIWRDQTYELFKNSTAFPRAYLASSYEVINNSSQILTRLFSDAFDRRESVILEQKPAVIPQKGEGTVSIVSYLPEKIIMNVTTTVPKLLFLSDVYDSGWEAYINDKKAPIYRADYTFRAIAVPKGNSTVIMVYEPESIRFGLIISAIALCTIAGLALRKRLI